MLFWSLKSIYNYAVTKIKIILTVEKSIMIMTIVIRTVTLLVMTKRVIGYRCILHHCHLQPSHVSQAIAICPSRLCICNSRQKIERQFCSYSVWNLYKTALNTVSHFRSDRLHPTKSDLYQINRKFLYISLKIFKINFKKWNLIKADHKRRSVWMISFLDWKTHLPCLFRTCWFSYFRWVGFWVEGNIISFNSELRT